VCVCVCVCVFVKLRHQLTCDDATGKAWDSGDKSDVIVDVILVTDSGVVGARTVPGHTCVISPMLYMLILTVNDCQR